MKSFSEYLIEFPAALDLETRPLVKDWEPSRFGVKWQRDVAQKGDIVLIEGTARFGMIGYGLIKEENGDMELLVACVGLPIQLKEKGTPYAKAFKMVEVAADKRFRGTGHGLLLHEMLIKQYGTIASDNALFSKTKDSVTGIVGIWLKELARKYKVRIYNESKDDFVGPVGKKLDDDENTILVAERR